MERNYLLFCLFFPLLAEKLLFKHLCFIFEKLSIMSYFALKEDIHHFQSLNTCVIIS